MLNRTDPKSLRKSIVAFAVSGSFAKQETTEPDGFSLLKKIESIGLSKGFAVDKTVAKSSIVYPKSWAVAKLSQIGFVTGGGTPDTSVGDYWQNGTFEWVTPADMSGIKGFYLLPSKRKITQLGIDNSSTKKLAPGSIVMSSRAPIGYIGINKGIACTSQGCKSLTLFDNTLMEPRYVLLAIKAALPEIVDAASNMTFKEISGKKFGEVVIPVPPLSEQKRIVEKFAEIEPLLSEYEKLRERESSCEKTIKDKLLSSALFSAFQKVEDNKNWPRQTLGDLMEIERGGSPRPISAFLTGDKNGINWIKIGDAPKNSKFIVSTQERITKEGATKSRMVYPGDFVISNSMSFGRPYILKTTGCIHDGWVVLRKPGEHFSLDYLFWLIRSPQIKQQFSKSAGGAVVKNLNIDKIKKTVVTVPPLSKQQEIAERMDCVEKVVDCL